MKQYLIMCDVVFVNQLKQMLNPQAIQFLEIQGMNLNMENKYNILVTPVTPPVPAAVIEPEVKPEEVVKDA